MAVFHGKDGDVWLDAAGGSLTDYTGYCDSANLSLSADMAEKSVLGDTSKSYVSGLKDATFSIEGPYDSTIVAALNSALGSSATKSFEYYPNGKVTGRDVWSGECFCTSLTIDTNLGGVGRFSADFQVSGGATLGASA